MAAERLDDHLGPSRQRTGFEAAHHPRFELSQAVQVGRAVEVPSGGETGHDIGGLAPASDDAMELVAGLRC
jgi:hypothetical protein